MQALCAKVLDELGPSAIIGDIHITTASRSQQKKQRLHVDHLNGAGKELKLGISTEGRALLTEFGAERTAMTAPSMVFDSVCSALTLPCPDIMSCFVIPTPCDTDWCHLHVQGALLHGAPEVEDPPRTDKMFICIVNPSDSCAKSTMRAEGAVFTSNCPFFFRNGHYSHQAEGHRYAGREAANAGTTPITSRRVDLTHTHTPLSILDIEQRSGRQQRVTKRAKLCESPPLIKATHCSCGNKFRSCKYPSTAKVQLFCDGHCGGRDGQRPFNADEEMWVCTPCDYDLCAKCACSPTPKSRPISPAMR